MEIINVSWRQFAGLVLLSLLWLAVPAGGVSAHESEQELPSAGGGDAQGVQGGTGLFVGELFARRMQAARAFMEKDQYPAAIRALIAMEEQSRAYNRYERAVLEQTLGYALASAGDYGKAAAAFQRALSAKGLPKDATLAVMQNLGQLYIADQQYAKGVATLEDWMRRVHPGDVPPRLRVMLGNAYLHQKRYAGAAAQLERAIAAAKHPDVAWFQLLANAYGGAERYADVAAALQRGIAAYPKKLALWQQLADAYRRLHQDKRAAATLALACGQGLCSAGDKLYLARLYLYLGVPLKAARFVEAALEDGSLDGKANQWTLLGDSWWRAREPERAVTAYRKAAEDETGGGEASFRLGRIYVQLQKWRPAVGALTQALRRGHLSDPGRARLLLGVARFYLGDLHEAATWFEAARRDREVATEARRWLQQVRTAGGSR